MKNTIYRALVALALLLPQANNVLAQTEKNTLFNCRVGEINYTEPKEQKENTSQSVGKILGSLVSAAAGASNTTSQHPEYADAVRSSIAGAVSDSWRFSVSDDNEGVYANGVAVSLDGNISAITVTQRTKVWTDKDKKRHESLEYKASITGNMTLKEAATGTLLLTLPINSTSYSFSWFSTPDKAIGEAIDRLHKTITATLDESYPLYASIVEGSTAKKDKQKEVYIDLGENMGLFKGTHFHVYTLQTIAGKEAKKEIGRLRVSEVMGEEISLCKVTAGGAAIKQAIDEGKTLLITSY